MIKQYSLRKRLLLWIGIPVLFISVLTIFLSLIFSWHEVEEVYDAQLAHSAKVLLQLTEHEIIEDDGDYNLQLKKTENSTEHEYEKNIAYRIWHKNRLITYSSNAESFQNIAAPPGFSDQHIKNEKWRFFVFVSSNADIIIETSEKYSIRYELIEQIISALTIPGLIFIPTVLLLVWFGAYKSLTPIIKTSNDVDKRNSEDLSPINIGELPQEIKPLISALNRLFIRIDESFTRERQFTDYAAHELRTPLAAMKTQTQVLLKKTAHSEFCPDGLKNLDQSISRATHMVNQLLALTRLQNEEFPKKTFNLSNCLLSVIHDLKDIKNDKAISLSHNIAKDIYINGNEGSIYILLRNLLDNAFKYTLENGSVSINLNRQGDFSIIDTGCGLNDRQKETAFNRFVRLDKTGQIGSGLGLSIVKWVAKEHNIKFTLTDNTPIGLIIKTQLVVISKS